MKEGYSNWRKLDNAALAFPLVTGKNDTRVFRFYCELKENVKPELLQTALEKTMEKYPLFQMVLLKGIILVLSGTQGYSSNCKGREEASMQQAVYSRQKESSFSRSAIMKKESILKFSMH